MPPGRPSMSKRKKRTPTKAGSPVRIPGRPSGAGAHNASEWGLTRTPRPQGQMVPTKGLKRIKRARRKPGK